MAYIVLNICVVMLLNMLECVITLLSMHSIKVKRKISVKAAFDYLEILDSTFIGKADFGQRVDREY